MSGYTGKNILNIVLKEWYRTGYEKDRYLLPYDYENKIWPSWEKLLLMPPLGSNQISTNTSLEIRTLFPWLK